MANSVNQPVSRYDGDSITCFPSSNAKDFGKLHTEFNEARYVTRIAKKNFCIKKPSFVATKIEDPATKTPLLNISAGEASINGMDIIASSAITIAPPTTAGTWYLAFKLQRDNLGRDFEVGQYKLKGNVLGDEIIGVQKTYLGVYLTYFDKRDDEGTEDPDMLYLAKVVWDGTDFTEIEDDPQKYSRIEAEDVGCYIKDPKHADVYYMDLQSWLFKVPDWYFSKEGDVCYGEINVVPGRGTDPSPYSDPMPGFILRAYDTNTTKMVLKASNKENATLMRYGDINNDGKIDDADVALLAEFLNGVKTPTDVQKKLACVSGNRNGDLTDLDLELLRNYVNGSRPALVKGEKSLVGKVGVIYGIGDVTEAIEVVASNSKVEIDMNHAQLYTNFSDDIFHIHNPEGLCLESGNGNIKLEAYNDIYLKRFDTKAPTFRLTGNVVKITDPDTPNLNFIWEMTDDKKAQYTLGKALFQYNETNSWLSLIGNKDDATHPITRFDILPSVYMENTTNRTIGTMYYGPEDGNNNNYMKRNEIMLDSNTADNVSLKMTDRYVYLKDENGGSTNSYFKVAGANGNNGVTAYSNGNMELKNTSGTSEIKFIGNSGTNSGRIYHNYNDNWIRVDTNFYVKNDFIADGDGRINGGDLYITKSAGQSNLYFSDGTKTYKIYHNNGETQLRVNTNLNLEGNNLLTTGGGYFGTLHVGTKKSDGTYPLNVDGNGNLSTSGTITGSKVYGAVYNDGVEFMEKEDYQENIEAGDVVYFTDNGKVSKFNTDKDRKRIAGIVSSEETYGWALGGDGLDDNQKVPIALFGRVYLKVNIDIKTGDLLAVDENGEICISEDLNRYVVGKATEPSKNNRVLVKIIN